MAESPSARGAGESVEPTQAELGAARRVAEAKATVPHVYFEADAAGEPSTAQLVHAVGAMLRELPRLNGAWRDARFELHARVNVGVAVSSEGGFAYPTIADADSKDPDAIAAELEALTERAVDGALTAAELAGATFSIVDLRTLGITRAQLAVNRGQAAILTAGRRGASTNLSLACDARIVRAQDAAAFLGGIRKRLEA